MAAAVFTTACSSPWLSPEKRENKHSTLSHFFPSARTNICDCRELGLPGAHDLILSALVTETHAAFSLLSELEW